MKEIYAWVPWFQELAGKIAEGGETYLAEAAKKVAWRDDDKKQPLLNYGDENIDPFSFFYSLAQRNQDQKSRKRIYPSIVKEFNMERQPPVESDEGFIFPTPSYRAQVLFHNKGQGRPTLLWNLFRGSVRGLDSVSPEDFVGALDIGNDWRVKLTQALFLINPSRFIPCDDKMAPFVKLPTADFDWERYKEWLQEVRGKFPGCEPYEINHFAYLRWSGRLPVRSDQCFQVSTNARGQGGGEYWKDFKDNHWVFTGGPGPGTGDGPPKSWGEYDEARDGPPPKYPLRDPKPGDVILVRTGTQKGRGIGIVCRNDYWDRLAADSRIHVIWLNKRTIDRLSGQTQRLGFDKAGPKTLNAFRQTPAYAETFALLDRLNGREETTAGEEEAKKTEVKHPKNQILYGPPGTGKTFHAVNHALAIIDGEKVHERREGDLAMFHELRDSEQIAMVTFHQNYAYEDFIEGIRPVLDDRVGSLRYELRDGIFKKIATTAGAEEDKRFVLIIDEINRGNIAKIFGELITLIEESRRVGADDETEVRLPYSGESFGVPDNLFLVGTMNTADRSIQLLDTALRRRFDFVEMMPEPEHPLISKDVEGVDCQAMLSMMNRRITALLDREHQIGHTYLMGVDTIETLSHAFQNRIFPLLQEYFFDDWSKIGAVLGGNDFVVETKTAGLFRESEQEVEERVYQRLPHNDTKWTEPGQYRRIYETPAEQSG